MYLKHENKKLMRLAFILTLLFVAFAINVAYQMIDQTKHQRMIGIKPSGQTVELKTLHEAPNV
ncbi:MULTISPECIES: hypothetical protein [Cysteiniphilum]|uniref:Uncharacterized protein n=1 Tax=Cysteiniphilum litorale TaxID=2056700 RepID=A0A8J2Z315_9GAMM|nr:MULTISPECIES: hypothetical protein [Cysteiniphilum]GGF92442.1 hypothetical protein GCM10010995_07030 [Cysteiniphilum litorale]